VRLPGQNPKKDKKAKRKKRKEKKERQEKRKPGGLTKQQKEALVRDTHEVVSAVWPGGGSGVCAYAAMTLRELARRRHGLNLAIQAGDCLWRRMSPAQDDGVSATHFGYQWDPMSPASMRAMIEGRMPEMHVWLGDTERQEVIDPTAGLFPEQCEKLIGEGWLDRKPPAYIWAPAKKIPDRAIYRPIRDATLVAGKVMATREHELLDYLGGSTKNPPKATRALSRVRKVVGRSRSCYPAAEVVYHAGGGRRAGLTPIQQRHQGRSHWWVRGPGGEVLDPAADQFSRPVPYERGKGKGFLTKKPSKRARALARRAGVRLNPDVDLRMLERRAATGDSDAAAALERARERMLPPPPNWLESYVEGAESYDPAAYLSPYGDYGVVPHSELAMHSRAAGRPVAQFALWAWQGGDRPTSAAVLFMDREGKEVMVRGGVGEVLPDEVRRELGGLGQERLPKENPPGDRGIRELERAVAGGDTDAVAPLIAALQRAGAPVPMGLRARFFAIHHADDHLVTYPNGKQRRVTNLGWLRRQLHRRGGGLTGNLLPLRFVVRTDIGPFPRECYLRVELSDGSRPPLPAGVCKCDDLQCKDRRREIRATLGYKHTHTFETMFASCHHLWDYLQTPLFEGEALDWDGRVGMIELRMHESTYGHPAFSEGGPDATCYGCHRAFWDDRLPSDPEDPHERGVATCPTCRGTLANPDEGGRRFERLAAAGDLEASARAIIHKVRSGKIPMAHVRLSANWTGRPDALLADPPPHDYMPNQYLLADRRDLVRWARQLDSMLPGSVTRRIEYRRLEDPMWQWLRGGKRLPPPWPGWNRPGSVYTDAFRIARARSDRRLHELVKGVIRKYRISVYQRFMDEMAGHHGEPPFHSPAWSLRDSKGLVVNTDPFPPGRVARRGWTLSWHATQPHEGTVRYDPLRMRKAAERQATDLLGRILLHEA
jgi:hypothetical protein